MLRQFLVLAIAFSFFAVSGAQEPTPMPSEYRTQLERYVGSWDTYVTIDGAKFTGTFTAKMAPGGACMVYQISAPGLISTDSELHGSGLIGWDHKAQALKEVSFNSLGETSTTLWKWKNGRLEGKRESIVLGQKSSSSVHNAWTVDGEKWEHHQYDWKLAGEKRSDVVRYMVRSSKS